ncbi:flagellar hook length control protein FliK [Enterobacter sp. PGRG2]|uniref:flagellar hook length control protein FliK n=1 Tax=Enterobacter sp. PGRG2 TaxID=3104013 RepID=UPI002ABE30E5|nr:flagellar hook length control protein FliK [Enterobacter sp. PGRG2]WJD48919.1 flagellar hook length control protein FliK [Enterobacter sp. PGRG2]
MISLPKLVMTDAEAPTSGLMTGKADTGAQDFMALLTGAISGTPVEGEGASLSLADLQAAGATLQKGLLSKDTGEADLRSPAAKLADILARQTVQEEALTEDVSQAQGVAPLLTSGLKSDSLALLNKTVKADDKETANLSEEEIASLSALLAMLPHQQNAQAAAPLTTTGTAASAAVTTAAGSRTLNLAAADPRGNALTDTADAAAGQPSHKDAGAALNAQLPGADSAQQAAAPVAANAAKADAQAAIHAVNTTVSAAPAVSTAAPAQASLPVAAPVISAPLGSSEWQQTISQNIMLFTRQGKQSAELRLHPEDLGQVQINLKLDDNQAQIQMMSPHSHVRAALEAALPTLRTSLAESGIQLGQSSISSESFTGQQQSSSQQQASRGSNRGDFGAEDDDALVVPASLQSAARGTGSVDIFA